MNKPTMKREIAIQSEGTDMIYFWCTPDAAQAMTRFGPVQRWAYEGQYQLIVDPRFDFQEVREYILNYGKDNP